MSISREGEALKISSGDKVRKSMEAEDGRLLEKAEDWMEKLGRLTRHSTDRKVMRFDRAMVRDEMNLGAIRQVSMNLILPDTWVMIDARDMMKEREREEREMMIVMCIQDSSSQGSRIRRPVRSRLC
jgi:hypothetical protein